MISHIYIRSISVLVVSSAVAIAIFHHVGIDKRGGHEHKYDRKDWRHWTNDGDCMNTRHEILNDQAEVGSVKLSDDGCYVYRGNWKDPFSGKTLTRASDIDVDHIIPLKWAHDRGAANWTLSKKERFANDPINLLAVDDGLNQQKGAKGPSRWMPPNNSYHCEYLARWQQVLDKYQDLKMTSSERNVFQGKKFECKSIFNIR